MQSRMTIKYTTYGKVEKTALYQILTYFTTERKNVLFRLDYGGKENEIDWDEIDVFIPKLRISKLEFADAGDREHYATFMCQNDEQRFLLRLLYNICLLGDPGHSYSILFDGNKVGWDGDGCDRIDEINFIKYWNKPKETGYTYIPDVLNSGMIYRKISDMYIHNVISKEEYDKAKENDFIGKMSKMLSNIQYQRFLKIKNRG